MKGTYIYLELNRYITSIIKTFFTEAVGLDSRFSPRARTNFASQNSTYKTQFSVLDWKKRLKSLKICELQSLGTMITKNARE